MKAESDGLIFHQLVREHTGCVSYIVGSKSDGNCIIVDPLMDVERYNPFVQNENLNIVALIDTHTHADHVSGMRYFSQFYPRAVPAIHESAPVEFQFEKLRDGEMLASWLSTNHSPKFEPDIRVIHTPGHASDHICLLIEGRQNKMLLSGDCLFIGDVGRTDLGRGDNDKMFESLFNKLLHLDPTTEVYPAHIGAKHFLESGKVKTTIGQEKESNPALKVKNKEEFQKYMTEGWPPKPEHFEEIISINLGKASLLEIQDKIAKVEAENLQRAKK